MVAEPVGQFTRLAPLAYRIVVAADGLRRRVGLRAWPMLRPTETELKTKLRQALGADRLDQAFSAGSRLNQQQAVAAAQDRRGTRAQMS